MIRLHEKEGVNTDNVSREIWVNPVRIIYFSALGNNYLLGSTVVVQTGDQTKEFLVTESPEEIVKLLSE